MSFIASFVTHKQPPQQINYMYEAKVVIKIMVASHRFIKFLGYDAEWLSRITRSNYVVDIT